MMVAQVRLAVREVLGQGRLKNRIDQNFAAAQFALRVDKLIQHQQFCGGDGAVISRQKEAGPDVSGPKGVSLLESGEISSLVESEMDRSCACPYCVDCPFARVCTC